MTLSIRTKTTNPWTFSEDSFSRPTNMETIADQVQAVTREIFFYWSRAWTLLILFLSRQKRYHQLDELPQWKKGGSGLFLLVHGLRCHPLVWDRHLATLKERAPGYDVVAPEILFRGNCPLKWAVEPLTQLVKRYIEIHPGQPICMIGHSNGGRIVASIENRLRGMGSPIKVSVIAGPFFGSKMANLVKKVPLSELVFNSVCIDELQHGSSQAKDIVSSMREAPSGTYDFYATRNDNLVRPWTSCFPNLMGKEWVSLKEGVGHNSLIERVRSEQIERCIHWMAQHEPISFWQKLTG